MHQFSLLILLLFFTESTTAQIKQYTTTTPQLLNTEAAKLIEQMIEEGHKMREKDTGLALGLLRKATVDADAIKNDHLKGRAFSHIAEIYYSHGVYNRALANFSLAVDLLYETGVQYDIAYNILGIAKSQYHRGNYTRATASFTEAIRRSEVHGLPAIKAEAHEYLGLVYGAFQNFHRNTDAYLVSLAIKQSLQDHHGVVRVAGNLSEIYFQLSMFDSAVIFADVAYNAAKKLGLDTEMYMAKIKKTEALVQLRKLAEAERELIFFKKFMIPPQDANLSVRYQTLLGSYFLAKKNNRLSNFHYDSALAIIKSNPFPELLMIVYKNMAAAYYGQGNIEKAFECYKKYNHQLGLFYTGDNITKLANLEGLVSLDASRDEIKNLQNENKLRALLLIHQQDLGRRLAWENFLKDSILKKEKILGEALARENAYKEEKLDAEKKLSSSVSSRFNLQQEKLLNEKKLRVTLLSGLVLLIALGVIIFSMYSRQVKKNKIIQQQSNDLQTLMKEIHHRVKNNLQVISSLLDLQANSLGNSQAGVAIKESRNRIQTMALIHQDLYGDKNINGIAIHTYIDNLAQNLFKTYNIRPQQVQLTTDIEKINLSADMIIPIGLVMNELISNSLKYAFYPGQPGIIEVILKIKNNHLFLQVKDNGKGFPQNMEQSSYSTFGMRMIKAFAQKLKAHLAVFNDDGACVTMMITHYK